jgi:Flp pilus assembly protein TadB
VSDRGTRAAIILGIVPIVLGVAYLAFNEINGTDLTLDMAGVTMLIALGLAMGFGFLVILRGAKDL